MAKTVEIKIPDDIEYRVIGNAFGLLIASAGLLAGDMVRNRSFDYWPVDIVPLALVLWMAFRMYRNFLSTINASQIVPVQVNHPDLVATPVRNEQVASGQITSKPSYSAEQVVEEIAKRIEVQKAEALKKNKFTN